MTFKFVHLMQNSKHKIKLLQYNLMEPVSRDGIPKVLFAGEATEPRAFSTVHGAR